MSWKNHIVGLASAVLASQLGLALAQQEQGENRSSNRQAAQKEATASAEQATKGATVSTKEKEKPKLKIFELKHARPSEMAQLLNYQAPSTAPSQSSDPFAAPPESGSAAARSSLSQNLNVAYDDEKQLLFLRGAASRIGEVEKLVKALDVAPDKLEKQSFRKAHLIPLRNAQASQLQSLLAQLGIPVNVVQLGKASLIVIHESDDEEMEQIEEIAAIFEKAGSERDSAANTPFEAKKENQEATKTGTR